MGNGFFKASYFNDLAKVKYTDEEYLAVEKQIQTELVMVYSKTYCPHCVRAKELLAKAKVEPVTFAEINQQKDGLTTQAILYKITRQKTVPSIFIAGKHIGGNSELQAMAKSGELRTLLEEAGVSSNLKQGKRE